MGQKVVFLDRDGVINRDSPEYIKCYEEFEFLPTSLEAIKILTQNNYLIIVITNQSSIARRKTSLQEVLAIHQIMLESVRNYGGNITDIFFCPHHPDNNCNCRKPKPGMIHQAVQNYDIDLADSVMIGDSATDIECARNAGCGQAILVKTGYKSNQENILAQKGIKADAVCSDLLDAARFILNLKNI